MRIEADRKLDYNNVLIRPKRSTISSRKEVDLAREFMFSIKQYRGIPIMASNMDGVGTFEMATTLAKKGMFTCLVKTYSIDKLVDFFEGKPECAEYTAYSMGITNDDMAKFRAVCKRTNLIKYVCVRQFY
jgi:GMP reductase